MHAEPIIAVAGENLIDTVQSPLNDGSMTSAHNLGGSPFNVAIALARQGMQTHFLTPISTDAFGQRLAGHLVENGVAVTGERRDEPTTQAIVTLEDGVPSYEFLRENTAERHVTLNSIQASQPKGMTHFHAGSLAFVGGDDAQVWEDAFTDAQRQGCSTSLDPNVRASLVEDPDAYRARIARLLAVSTIVKLSDEDLHWLFPDLDQTQAIAKVVSSTPAKVVALTKGPDGAEIWAGDVHCAVPNPPPFKMVDTIGAGDTFMASLLARVLSKPMDNLTQEDLRDITSWSIHAACLNCLKEGCDPPSSAAIEAALVDGLPTERV
ncbi:Sugar kinase, ribokinase [Sulfitobacter noctilucae]|uniref:carbohydrate kinase family protein n=1 Tax=Sulfitobacter noctilucae TaxID=1342302 RepID=UPI00069BE459|nr:carbohydrate kinase [Sulfitobacter noctilucae]KIN60670.1 Sugar kinase, ribokinase [Sulfitobacter noctilucae]